MSLSKTHDEWSREININADKNLTFFIFLWHFLHIFQSLTSHEHRDNEKLLFLIHSMQCLDSFDLRTRLRKN